MEINILDDKHITKLNPYTRLNVFCPPQKIHGHTFFEFILVLNGACKHSLNGNPQEELPAGTLLLIRPGEYHYIGFAGKDCIYRDYYANMETMREICASIGEGFFEEVMQLDRPYKISLSLHELNALKNKSNYFNNPVVIHENDVHLSRLHRTIIAELLSKFVEQNLTSTSDAPNWLLNLRTHLAHFDYVTLSLDEIIKKTGYSNGYVSQMFTKYFHESLISFHNKNKVIYSCQLLGNMRIIDIATYLGWDNPKNYDIQFQRVFGLSPSQYIKQNRQPEHISL